MATRGKDKRKNSARKNHEGKGSQRRNHEWERSQSDTVDNKGIKQPLVGFTLFLIYATSSRTQYSCKSRVTYIGKLRGRLLYWMEDSTERQDDEKNY